MMETQPLVKLSRVAGGYGGKTVIRDVSLEVFPNDFLGIVGPNGGGKTTLVKLMTGLLKPTSGEIEYGLHGQLRIGYLPQYAAVDRKFPISVFETILSGLHGMKSPLRPFTEAHREQARRTVARMGLEGLEERPVGELSGGQLRRVLLGRTLVSEPHVLILDEPNAYIDRRSETGLYTLLKEINGQCAVVMVSHDMRAVEKYAKNIAFVDGTLTYCKDAAAPADYRAE